MGRNQRARAAKRERRKNGRRWAVQVFEGPPLGPDVVTADVADVLGAIETIQEDFSWDAIADHVIPMFQRVRPYHETAPEPLRVVVPPGLSVGFGVDIGPAFVNVHPEMAADWGLTSEAILARALDNLERRMAGVAPGDVYDGLIGGVPVRMLQSSTGSASTYVLLPASLGRILGDHGQLVIAPMRNLLISLPIGTDRDFAAWLFDEIASQDPNALAPAAFVVGDGRLRPESLGESFGAA